MFQLDIFWLGLYIILSPKHIQVYVLLGDAAAVSALCCCVFTSHRILIVNYSCSQVNVWSTVKVVSWIRRRSCQTDSVERM